MSELPDAAIEAAAEAIHARWDGECFHSEYGTVISCERDARVAIAAAMPAIREHIAQEIEAEMEPNFSGIWKCEHPHHDTSRCQPASHVGLTDPTPTQWMDEDEASRLMGYCRSSERWDAVRFVEHLIEKHRGNAARIVLGDTEGETDE